MTAFAVNLLNQTEISDSNVKKPALLMRTTLVTCPLGGWLLLAATPLGICALTLGDDPEMLQNDLRRRFPVAAFHPADAQLTGLAQRLVRALEGTETHLKETADHAPVPLDLHGTPFQRRVWAALQTVPAGTTTTYAALAAHIGAPASVRAIANACGANPVAIVVPCHRVIRSDGGLSGYRWGGARKRALLQREGYDF